MSTIIYERAHRREDEGHELSSSENGGLRALCKEFLNRLRRRRGIDVGVCGSGIRVGVGFTRRRTVVGEWDSTREDTLGECAKVRVEL